MPTLYYKATLGAAIRKPPVAVARASDSERATRTERADEAARESVSGSPRGNAPRITMRGTMSTTTAAASAPTSLATVPLWINGQRAEPHGTRTGVVSNPATGDVIRHVAFADAHDVDRAVQPRWRRLPGWGAALRCARSRADAVPRADGAEPERARAAGQRGARQGVPRRDGIGAARHRGHRVRRRRAAPPQGRARRIGRPRRRRLLAAAAARRVSPASRRSTSRRWCRCGCSRSRSRAATRSS